MPLSFAAIAVFFAAGTLFGADAGKFQLVVAAPDPVVASEDVTFQLIAVNVGTEKWQANQYYLEAEIYDAQKKYLAKTSRQRGINTIDPGSTGLFYIPFNVPSNYVGTYFYKVYLVYKEQRIIESDFSSFGVVPLPYAPPKPAEFKLGGNAVLSYRHTSRYEWKDYTGNFSLNLVGQLMEHAMLFNLYTFHTPVSTTTAQGVNSEIYTILFNYYGTGYSLGLGDVLPTFSPLSLYGTGMRGAQYEGKSGIFSTSLVGARTAKSVEGNTSTNGTFERWLVGAKAGVDLPLDINLSGNYVTSFDRQESINTFGPVLAPANNVVTGAVMQWLLADYLNFTAEYQTSSYWADTRLSTSSINDTAYRAELMATPRNFTIRTSIQETKPNFYSFGSPGSPRDRQTLDFYASGLFFNRLTLNAGANRFRDNLGNDASKVTTTQSIYNAGVSYNTPGRWPKPSLSYATNEAVGDPKTAQDNYTNNISLGLSSQVGIINLGLSLQQSAFRDRNKISDDLDTNTAGLTINSSFKSRLSLNFGVTSSDSKNLSKTILSKSPSYSFSINYSVVPNKLAVQTWGTFMRRQNDATAQTLMVDRQDSSGNLEFTWLVNPSLAWTLGGSYVQVIDTLTAANDIIERGVNTRLSYSF
jgi:hypothetical protein